MSTLEKAIEAFHQAHGIDKMSKTIWIAFSGGLDSHVLLHLYARLRDRLNTVFSISIRALHVNHGLHPEASAWSLQCAHLCQSYGINFVEKSIEIKLKPGESLEEIAREKRYAVFEACMAEGDILLTAHHQDDQAETTLIQLMRGAGLKGLAGMPDFKPWKKRCHGRPLLSFSKKTLEHYAHQHGLHWIHDGSNDNPQWTRNFIRHAVLPSLQKRWPTVTKAIARSASYAAEAQKLLESIALEDIAKMAGTKDHTLSIRQLNECQPARQRLILRTWIHALGHPLPSADKLKTIQENVLTARLDRTPSVCWKNSVIRRYRNDLYLTAPLPTHDKHTATAWHLTHALTLSGIGQLKAVKKMGCGLQMTIQEVTIRFRQGGEIFHLPGRGRHTLKNLLQEWGVPPWQRDRIPLIYFQDTLIGLVGFSLAADYTAKENEIGHTLILEQGVAA